MSDRILILHPEHIESFWETADAVLVKTINGKIWFCKKETEEEMQKKRECLKQNKPIEFILRKRRERNK